jgi:uncharacterized protein YcfL
MKKYILIFTIILLTALSFGCASNKIESQNVSTSPTTSINADPLTIVDSNLSKVKDGEYSFTMTIQANKDVENPNVFYDFYNKTGETVEDGVLVTPSLKSGEKYVYTDHIYSDDEIVGYNLTQD